MTGLQSGAGGVGVERDRAVNFIFSIQSFCFYNLFLSFLFFIVNVVYFYFLWFYFSLTFSIYFSVLPVVLVIFFSVLFSFFFCR